MSETIEVVAKQQILGKEITVYGTAKEPLVLAKDVAKWIDHSDVSTLLRNVDDDEKVEMTNPNNVCGGQKAWFLTENGVYEVLMQSRKPIAKQFKKEVKRILHDLRVNGISVTKGFASQSIDQQIQKCLQACAVATNQIEILTKANVILVNERDEAISTVEEQKAHIEWIDGQRMDMAEAVERFAPLEEQPDNSYPVRGHYRTKTQKTDEVEDSTDVQNSYKSMVRNAISKGCMTDLELENLKTVIRADEIKGTKHTKDECVLLKMYGSGRISIIPTII